MAGDLGESVLAIDIGGTKILGALVQGRVVSDAYQIQTPTSPDPRSWIAMLLECAPHWYGRYHRVGAAVTGVVEDGYWSALNPRTLTIPDNYPIQDTLVELTGLPATVANDAQAAAWGEYRFGAGQGTRNCVFLTVSTGIGGGVIVNGTLLNGLAGHFGQFRNEEGLETPFESRVAGRWIAEAASLAGYDLDAKGVFEAAEHNEQWAQEIRAQSAARLGRLCANIQLALAPERIVIGGSIGLARGFIEQISASIWDLPPRQRPLLVAAQLGGHAGIVGIAHLAMSSEG